MEIIADKRFLIVFFITFFIYFLSSFAGSLRFAGIKNKLITTSFSLSNIVYLVVRLSNLIQTPFLGSMVDIAYKEKDIDGLAIKLHLIILASTLGSICGIIFFTTGEKIFSKWIEIFDKKKNIISTFIYSLNLKTIYFLFSCLSLPKFYLDKDLLRKVPSMVFWSSCIVGAFWTTGVLSAIYASVIVPEFARTATILSGIVNGVATILYSIFLDPIIANITDKVYNEQEKIEYLYNVIWVSIIASILGTLLAHFVLYPGAWIIAQITLIFSKI